jgi:ABC-type lipoprotein export system ATPase subunit
MNENNIHMELKDVWKIYKDGDKIIHALSRINCSFQEGSFNIIQGPSGSGKSTLIRISGLLESPTMGKVLINGKNTADFPQKKRNSIIREDIGLVFQGSNLIPTINAIENLTLPMISSDNKKARILLEKVGFNDYKKFPDEMSVEEEQRVCIARAMVNNHSLILADEPTGDLHTSETEDIMKLLLDLNKNEGLTIIITSNNRKLYKFDGNMMEMVDGTIYSE